MISCSQHDARSVIADQRIPCEGKVVAIPYKVHNEYDQKVFEDTATVCEAHMFSWTDRGLEGRGYRLGKPREIGVIDGNPESSGIALEREG